MSESSAQHLERVQKQANDWKRKATERREEIDEMKARLSRLEEMMAHLLSERDLYRKEVESLKRQLKISNQSIEKLKIENQELKKKARS